GGPGGPGGDTPWAPRRGRRPGAVDRRIGQRGARRRSGKASPRPPSGRTWRSRGRGRATSGRVARGRPASGRARGAGTPPARGTSSPAVTSARPDRAAGGRATEPCSLINDRGDVDHVQCRFAIREAFGSGDGGGWTRGGLSR